MSLGIVCIFMGLAYVAGLTYMCAQLFLCCFQKLFSVFSVHCMLLFFFSDTKL